MDTAIEVDPKAIEYQLQSLLAATSVDVAIADTQTGSEQDVLLKLCNIKFNIGTRGIQFNADCKIAEDDCTVTGLTSNTEDEKKTTLLLKIGHSTTLKSPQEGPGDFLLSLFGLKTLPLVFPPTDDASQQALRFREDTLEVHECQLYLEMPKDSNSHWTVSSLTFSMTSKEASNSKSDQTSNWEIIPGKLTWVTESTEFQISKDQQLTAFGSVRVGAADPAVSWAQAESYRNGRLELMFGDKPLSKLYNKLTGAKEGTNTQFDTANYDMLVVFCKLSADKKTYELDSINFRVHSPSNASNPSRMQSQFKEEPLEKELSSATSQLVAAERPKSPILQNSDVQPGPGRGLDEYTTIGPWAATNTKPWGFSITDDSSVGISAKNRFNGSEKALELRPIAAQNFISAHQSFVISFYLNIDSKGTFKIKILSDPFADLLHATWEPEQPSPKSGSFESGHLKWFRNDAPIHGIPSKSTWIASNTPAEIKLCYTVDSKQHWSLVVVQGNQVVTNMASYANILKVDAQRPDPGIAVERTGYSSVSLRLSGVSVSQDTQATPTQQTQ